MVLMALMAYNALAHRTWCSLQQVEHVNHRWVSSQIVHVGIACEVSLNVPKNFFIYDSAPTKSLPHVKIDENLRRTYVWRKRLSRLHQQIYSREIGQ